MFPRKILPKIHFFCVLALVRSQNYEYSSDEGDTESDIEGDSHPDYSKYYSVTPKDGGIALAPFAQPQQFGFGFGPFEAAYGASTQEKQKLIPTPPFTPLQPKPVVESTGSFDFFNKNLFGINQPPADYFEQSQTRQREEASEEPSEDISEDRENEEESEETDEKSAYNQPGPNYITHDIPVKIPHQVETVKIQDKNRANGLNLLYPSSKVHDLRDYKDHHKYLPQQSVAPQIYPQATGYHKLTQNSGEPSLTPYQKYSFQPVTDYHNKYLENLNSESAISPNYRSNFARVNIQPYISQESRVSPRAAQRKNCKKLKKGSGSEKIGDLTCYVCENEETNSKVTECSYQSEPTNKDLHKGSSERYSVPATRPDGFRYRRYASEEDSDPYEYVRNRSLRAENEKQKEEDDKYDYEGYDASQPEKNYSEIQSDEILKDPKKCSNVERDGMSCRVCKDSATGGNYESCSFTSAPEPEKYAYVSEKNYNSKDDPEYASEGDESKNIPTNTKSSDEDSVKDKKPHRKERKLGKKYSKSSELKHPKGSRSNYSDYEHPKQVDTESWEDQPRSKGEKSSYPKYRAETRQQSKVLKNEEDEEDTKSNSESYEDPYKDIEEYKFKYFPEESRAEEEQLTYAGTSKKEVEDVLADFKKKDRSQCKQVKKNGMTCFLCVNENRVKNEECMFISESRPKGTYAKYTKSDEVGASSEAKPTRTHVTEKKPVSNRKKRSDKKILVEESSKIAKVVRAPEVPELKASASAHDAQRIEETDDEPKLETPQEFETTDEGGAYSAETKPVYSKTLGMTLPKYMVDKSEFEKEFDSLLKHN